jgi:hypothetical protein
MTKQNKPEPKKFNKPGYFRFKTKAFLKVLPGN